jgi:hypothetical protein
MMMPTSRPTATTEREGTLRSSFCQAGHRKCSPKSRALESPHRGEGGAASPRRASRRVSLPRPKSVPDVEGRRPPPIAARHSDHIGS